MDCLPRSGIAVLDDGDMSTVIARCIIVEEVVGR